MKGGNALSLALGLSKRTSLDLDFSIENDFEDMDDTRGRIQGALENRFLAEGFVVFDFKFGAKPSVVPEGQSPRWGGYMASFKVMEKQKYERLEGDLGGRRRNSLVIGPGQQRVFTKRRWLRNGRGAFLSGENREGGLRANPRTGCRRPDACSAGRQTPLPRQFAPSPG